MIVQREPNEKSSNEDKEDIENLITVPNCFILISCGICEFLAVMVMCIGCSQIVPSFFILMLEKQGLANWPMGGIWLSACFFIKKVLLEHSSIHSFYVSSMAVITLQWQLSSCDRAYGPQGIKYLLFGPLQKLCRPLFKNEGIL